MTNSETFYAWMGDEDNDEFDVNTTDHVSVTLTANPNALGIRISTDVNDDANGNTVDVGKDTTVVITAQLIDLNTTGANAMAITDAGAIAKAGVDLAVTYLIAGTAARPAPDAVTTDADGKATFTITHNADDDDDVDNITDTDTVTFSGNVDGDAGDSAETAQTTVIWTDAASEVTGASAETASSYAIIDDDEVSIRATASYVDQYGNADAQNQTLTITFDNDDQADLDSVVKNVKVKSNGTVSTRGNLEADAGDEITVVVSQLVGDGSGVNAPTVANVLAVDHANKNDDGVSAKITAHTDDDRFIIDTAAKAGVLYSYDSGDTFIVDDKTVDMDAFEEAIADDGAVGVDVDVVLYSVDGMSIFSATN